MSDMPKDIAVIDGPDDYGKTGVWPRVGTWSEWWEGADDDATRYIRADLVAERNAADIHEISRLRAENEELRTTNRYGKDDWYALFKAQQHVEKLDALNECERLRAEVAALHDRIATLERERQTGWSGKVPISDYNALAQERDALRKRVGELEHSDSLLTLHAEYRAQIAALHKDAERWRRLRKMGIWATFQYSFSGLETSIDAALANEVK